ncbi:hypothetical protein M1116_01215 [Patescibacteria group bacterium]|nr:hypothetical protein [Patescibacteria group bacterium]
MTFFESLKNNIGKLGLFWQQKINSQLLRLNLIVIAIQLAFLIYKFNQLPPEVPLFYSLPFGESQLGSTSQLFFIPIFSITIGLINTVFAALFVGNKSLLSRSLIIFSLIYSLLSLITLYQIITLIS